MAKKATKSIEAQVLTIKFANDTVLVVRLTDIPEATIGQLAMHGLSQKIGDSYAGADSIDEASTAAGRVAEDLKAGNWSVRVAGSGAPRVTLLAEALAKLTNNSMEDSLEAVNELNDDQKKALRKDDRVKEAIAEIKYERAKAKAAEASGDQPDLAALLAG